MTLSATCSPPSTTSRSLPGVVAISMSFGYPELKGDLQDDSHFTTPAGHVGGGKLPGGITFVAASGDSGVPPSYPATSPNVLSVGGTTLSLDAFGNILAETGWSGSGGGISTVEPLPTYQQGVAGQGTSNRTNPDVAYDADPATGFDVYDSIGGGAWSLVGGTRAGAPNGPH